MDTTFPLDIRIGFEQSEYRFNETEVSFNEEDSPIALIKEAGTISEQAFRLGITVGPGDQPGFGDAEFGMDYNATEGILVILPEQQSIRFPFALIADDLPEGTEAFQLQVSREGEPFDIGISPAIVFIEDNDGEFIHGNSNTK